MSTEDLLSAARETCRCSARARLRWLGPEPWFTEFDADGNVVFDGHFAKGADSYRAIGSPARATAHRLRSACKRSALPRDGLRELERRHGRQAVAGARRSSSVTLKPVRMRRATASRRRLS